MARDVSHERLINLVHARPALWDKKCLEYGDRITKSRMWEGIFVEATPNWASLSDKQRWIRGQKIVTRWTSQRDRYRREFKGEAEDKRSGAGASKKRRSPFFEITIPNISEIEERRGMQAQRIPSKRKRWEFNKLSRVPNNLRLTNCRQIKNQQQQEPRRKDVCLFDLFEPPRQ